MPDRYCEIPEYNPPPEEIRVALEKYKIVAIVGLSPKPERDSYRVAKYLKENHYEIVPVNPGQKQILGEACYPNLKAIPFPVDVVDIFRNPDAIPPVVDDAIEIGAKVVWMQLGLAHNKAADKAREAGLEVVMNKCIKTEHLNMLKQNGLE
ncbi:MAG: CoA-binding protein [Desulfobacterales bacterium]|nr:MAG: CoA-binding protein [Desulfobacterales bacterium]UCG80619.1 MAG: CoA-binding protein [Desulfobacterales bacterium]